jgi:tRNA pseudouridine55 synthase
VSRFEVLAYRPPLAFFAMEISSGGYVRSIAHEMGQLLGCGAHLAGLRREQAGEFTLEDAVTLETLAGWAVAGTLEAHLPHPRTLLPQMPAVTVDEGTAGRIRNGMACNLPEYSQSPLVKIFTSQRGLLAIGRRVAGTLVQPTIVLGGPD